MDDEPANLLALQAVLEDMGHELVSARSGREALRCLMNGDFSIILMDVQMPTMDGFETAALIRGRERFRDTPFIFLTAVGRSESDMFRGYEVGAVDYLLKPFIPAILRYKVAVLMSLRAKSAELAETNQELKTLNTSLEERVRTRTAELEIKSKLLSRSNEELDQFASVASHDLQEPLRSMTTYLFLLARALEGKVSAEARAHIEAATESARRMKRLVSGLLEFSRIEARGSELQRVDCDGLLKEVLAALDSAIKEKGARITIMPLPAVQGNPVMLLQLFQNLLDNALKFSGGQSPKIELGADRFDRQARFWVRDHGIGIDQNHFLVIFKLFKRLHTSEEYPGSGLGLALCKKIVDRHGGRLWLESVPGQGSTFYFTLPLEVDHERRILVELEALRSGGGGRL